MPSSAKELRLRIAMMISAFGDAMKDDLFKEKVGEFSARDISRTAKERRSGSLGYAESMLIAYNKKMKYPLRWSKLYATKLEPTGDDGDEADVEFEESDTDE